MIKPAFIISKTRVTQTSEKNVELVLLHPRIISVSIITISLEFNKKTHKKNKNEETCLRP